MLSRRSFLGFSLAALGGVFAPRFGKWYRQGSGLLVPHTGLADFAATPIVGTFSYAQLYDASTGEVLEEKQIVMPFEEHSDVPARMSVDFTLTEKHPRFVQVRMPAVSFHRLTMHPGETLTVVASFAPHGVRVV